jgi:hypothetical protein
LLRLPSRSLPADGPAAVDPAAVDPAVAGLVVLVEVARVVGALEFPVVLALVDPALEAPEALDARASVLVLDRSFRFRLPRCLLAGSAMALL